tara:strand:- start:25 stop:270 length:246 start_codon:yes stop_codon:yes gene_type:complete
VSKKLSFKNACFQWASNFYLYEEVHDDYFELSEEDQHEHLEQYAWQPFELEDGYKIERHIDDLAEHIIQEVYPKKEDFKND